MLINFDFDGVIADTFDELLQLCARAQVIINEGRPPTKQDLHEVENLTFAGLAERLEIPGRMTSHFLDTCFLLQKKASNDVNFFPKMASLLKELGKSNTIAIISSSNEGLINQSLHEYGVYGSIDSLCGGEKGRSKRDSILHNISIFSVPPLQTCMVGDAISDIRQGKEAGVTTVGVTWGFQPSELLQMESPDYLADSPEHLLEILKGLGA